MKLNLHPKGIPKQEPLGADTPLKKGGVVVGMRKEGDKEKIYFVGDDCHLLCVGATRSGKSRCLVLESICLLGLAGESIFCSDPKAELFHYTADFLKKLGYEVLVLDFKNPEKSMRYNLLQPIIDAINEGNTDRAEMLAWDLTNNLVGKPEGEKIWTNGEYGIPSLYGGYQQDLFQRYYYHLCGLPLLRGNHAGRGPQNGSGFLLRC